MLNSSVNSNFLENFLANTFFIVLLNRQIPRRTVYLIDHFTCGLGYVSLPNHLWQHILKPIFPARSDSVHNDIIVFDMYTVPALRHYTETLSITVWYGEYQSVILWISKRDTVDIRA